MTEHMQRAMKAAIARARCDVANLMDCGATDPDDCECDGVLDTLIAAVRAEQDAEIARLREQLHAANMDCVAVEAERNDYRVALTEIMEYCEGWPNDAAHMAVMTARAALRSEGA